MSVQSLVKCVAFAGAVAFASGAMADGGPRGSVKDARAPAPFSWTGAYIGASAGGVWGESGASIVPADAASAANLNPGLAAGFLPSRYNNDVRGAIFGLNAGYNLQFSSFVVGLEADFSGSTAGGNQTVVTQAAGFFPGRGNMETNLEWLGTVRARLGVLLNPTLLAYATGGFAYGEVSHSFAAGQAAGAGLFPNLTYSIGQGSSMRTGWTAGGGLEWAFAPRATFRAEYLYVNLEGDSFTSGTLAAPAGVCIGANNCNISVRGRDFESHIARVGVNFKL